MLTSMGWTSFHSLWARREPWVDTECYVPDHGLKVRGKRGIKTLEVPTRLTSGCAGNEAGGKLQTEKGAMATKGYPQVSSVKVKQLWTTRSRGLPFKGVACCGVEVRATRVGDSKNRKVHMWLGHPQSHQNDISPGWHFSVGGKSYDRSF